jgi:hypothetical protein
MDNTDAHHKRAQKHQAKLAKSTPAQHTGHMITAQFAILQNPPASGPAGPMT